MPPAIIILLLVAAIWGAFLLPDVFSSRKSAPLATTQEFTRWSSRIATFQKPQGDAAMMTRHRVLARRRRTLGLLIAVAVALLGMAIWQSSPGMLLAHIILDGAIAWYLAMLVQIKQRREALAAVTPVRPVSDVVVELPSAPDVRILING